MPYATQYQGDYKTYGYAGDPGFLSNLWKGFKKVAKFMPGPIGTVARLAGTVAVAGAAAQVLRPTPPIFQAAPDYGQLALPMSPSGQLTRFAPGRAASFGQGAMVMPGADAAGCCPTGFHPRKDKRLPFKCVRNRRMNVGNAKALRRGMRRVSGFEKLARRTITFTKRVRIKTRKT